MCYWTHHCYPDLTAADDGQRAVGAGRYGRTHRIGRIVYVDLAEVARAEGREFSDEQIERASAGLPDRILVITENEVA